jgi:hypothetical protein
VKLEGVRTEMSSQNETEEKEVGEVNGSRGRRKGKGGRWRKGRYHTVCDRLLAGGLRLVYGSQIVICH